MKYEADQSKQNTESAPEIGERSSFGSPFTFGNLICIKRAIYDQVDSYCVDEKAHLPMDKQESKRDSDDAT